MCYLDVWFSLHFVSIRLVNFIERPACCCCCWCYCLISLRVCTTWEYMYWRLQLFRKLSWLLLEMSLIHNISPLEHLKSIQFEIYKIFKSSNWKWITASLSSQLLLFQQWENFVSSEQYLLESDGSVAINSVIGQFDIGEKKTSYVCIVKDCEWDWNGPIEIMAKVREMSNCFIIQTRTSRTNERTNNFPIVLNFISFFIFGMQRIWNIFSNG